MNDLRRQPIGVANLLALDDLPRLKDATRARYEGSIDKRGDNADWDWHLYTDARGEHVLFDVDGPGCVYAFVQHRFPDTPQPTYRFYFDGEASPRFEIEPHEFGGKVPFVEPLAGYFLGDDSPPRGRGPIRVVRSFVPMAFRAGCRITSSVKLVGNDRSKGEGGWGHVTWHALPTADGVETFTGREDYSSLLARCDTAGQLPETRDAERVVTVAAGASTALLAHDGAGVVTSVVLRLLPFDPQLLGDLWIVMQWDDHARPDVAVPIGAFFGNEYGQRRVGLMTHGQTSDGRLYARWPMPFWASARIEIQNRGDRTATLTHTIAVESPRHERAACGYFRATDYRTLAPAKLGEDTLIGEATGRGHIVAATVTGRSIGDAKYVSCEGDVRLYVDGNATPQIESDGSESHVGYGWGFVSPGQQNPVSGYDGSGEPTCEFSMTRSHPGDWIPFRTGFRFGIEAGERNDYPMKQSGVVFYYGVDDFGMTLTDTLDVGDAASESAHGYTVDGETWQGELESSYETGPTPAVLRDRGSAFGGSSSFTLAIAPDNAGVRLRLRLDQQSPRRRARVRVDGVVVAERDWSIADHNPHFRWLDSEFDLPASYTRGRSSIRVTIERVVTHADGTMSPPWSEFRYEAFSLKV